ncbi:hypothetical protein EV1_004288 [Malus domestica]
MMPAANALIRKKMAFSGLGVGIFLPSNGRLSPTAPAPRMEAREPTLHLSASSSLCSVPRIHTYNLRIWWEIEVELRLSLTCWKIELTEEWTLWSCLDSAGNLIPKVLFEGRVNSTFILFSQFYFTSLLFTLRKIL